VYSGERDNPKDIAYDDKLGFIEELGAYQGSDTEDDTHNDRGKRKAQAGRVFRLRGLSTIVDRG